MHNLLYLTPSLRVWNDILEEFLSMFKICYFILLIFILPNILCFINFCFKIKKKMNVFFSRLKFVYGIEFDIEGVNKQSNIAPSINQCCCSTCLYSHCIIWLCLTFKDVTCTGHNKKEYCLRWMAPCYYRLWKWRNIFN